MFVCFVIIQSYVQIKNTSKYNKYIQSRTYSINKHLHLTVIQSSLWGAVPLNANIWKTVHIVSSTNGQHWKCGIFLSLSLKPKTSSIWCPIHKTHFTRYDHWASAYVFTYRHLWSPFTCLWYKQQSRTTVPFRRECVLMNHILSLDYSQHPYHQHLEKVYAALKQMIFYKSLLIKCSKVIKVL